MIVTAAVVVGLSGLPACLLPGRPATGQRLATALMVGGSLLGLVGVGAGLRPGASISLQLPWFLPWGQFAVAVDALGAVFLLPVFVVPALGAIYGLGYWPAADHPDNRRQLGLFYGLLAGAMALVVVARDGVLLLIVWEVMALAAYFAATVEEDNPEVRRAGWVYLVATHVGTLALIAMFALWRLGTGSFALTPAAALSPGVGGALFGLALLGFGFKAGLMPLHVWLPGAHANAPSHVSAVMSGVMLKMGIYGMVRMTALLPHPQLWWGGVLLGVGAFTGVVGIAYAIGQHDLKRLLAYSSIENIGIIAMGLGLALLGRCQGRLDWVLLGLGGALLHLWNHSLFKALLFFNAGAIIHATHTREMDRLGGLAKTMPRTTALFVVGAAAICALPPLNGFAGEWLLYVGLFRTLGMDGGAGLPAAALAAVALSLIGALAVACFVKLLGGVFLGSRRETGTAAAHDPGASMLAPMVVLAVGCVGLGLLPAVAAPLLEQATRTWMGLPPAAALSLAGLAPLGWVTVVGAVLLLVVVLLWLVAKLLPRAKAVARAGTWDCGYAWPTARMQYTNSSFGQSLVKLFAVVLWPRHRWPGMGGLFPGPTSFRRLLPDAILDRLVLPLFAVAARCLPWIRVLQQGQTHFYVLYILIILIFLLVWGTMGVQP